MKLNLDRSTWRTVKFGEIAENVNDRVDDPKSAGVSRYVGLEHLDPGSLTVTRWGTPDQVEATKLRFKPGDVIFGRRRAYQKKVARADFEGICSAHAMVLRAKPGVVDPDFLPVFLSSDYFLNRAIRISVGSLSPTVNWKTLAAQEFELPPLADQRRIADLLWAIDAERHSSASVVRSALDIEAALLNALVDGDVGTRPLKDFVILRQGRPVPSELYGASGVRLLRAGDLKPRGAVLWSDNSVWIPQSWADHASAMMLKPGDLVINMTAQTLDDAFLGRVCQITEDCLLNQRIGRLDVVDTELRDFLFAVLRSPRFTDYVAQRAEGSKVKHMHWRHIEAFPVPDPSDWKSGASEVIERAASAVRQAEARTQSATALGRAFLADCLGNA